MKLIFAVVLAAVIFYWFRQHQQAQAQLPVTLREGQEYLAYNKTIVGVRELASGLQIMTLEPAADANAVKPGAQATVTVHYEGRLIDGTIFDSSYQRNEPISFGLQQVIAGWTEGLQQMQVGEKARLVIPSQLGYGNRKAGKIPAGSVLIFDVELLAVR